MLSAEPKAEADQTYQDHDLNIRTSQKLNLIIVLLFYYTLF